MRTSRCRILSGFILLVITLTGCRPAPLVAASILDTAVPAAQVSAQRPAPPLPVLELPDIFQGAAPVSEEFPAVLEPPPAAPIDAVPLELAPQPALAEVDWRPPLYPIPWAPGPFDHFYFNRPIQADENFMPLDDYRYGYTYEGFDSVHTGIDIDSPVGTPIYAAGSGKVIWSGYGQMRGVYDPDDPYGLAIVIKHDFGYADQHLYTLYAHLSQAYVQFGTAVTTGQLIGLVGITGATTGPHLHFEVRIGENGYFESRNPELWLAPAQGWGVLVAQIKDTSGRLIKGKDVFINRVDNPDGRRRAITYGARSVNSDAYYGENLVISDLPAGKYEISYVYLYKRWTLEVEVFPGRITYFSFQGRKGFSTELPIPPESNLTPFSP